jgi:hypothetical protein
MCAVEQYEARLLQETKHDLVHHIMNVDEIESEEFPMSPEIIAREQKKDTHLKEVMKKSDKFSERIVERSTVITYENKIYIPISLRKRTVWWYHTYLQHPGITRMEDKLRKNLVKLLPLPQTPPPARPHGCTDKSKRPESHPTEECARARVRCLNTEPNYY